MKEDSVRQSGFLMRMLLGLSELLSPARRKGILGEPKRSRWQRTASCKHSSGGKRSVHKKAIAKRRVKNKMAAKSRRINRKRAA